jgi:hypothetical protein
VIAYTVTQRRREIGIGWRSARSMPNCGADSSAMDWALTCVGLAIGVAVSTIVTRLMTSLLFEVSPLDPLTYVAVALLLTTAAAMASYVPRRASAVPPDRVFAAQ